MTILDVQVEKTYKIEVPASTQINLLNKGLVKLKDIFIYPQKLMNWIARKTLDEINKSTKGVIKGSEELGFAASDLGATASYALSLGGLRGNVLIAGIVETIAGSFAMSRDWFSEFYPEILNKHHGLIEKALDLPENSLIPEQKSFNVGHKGQKAKFRNALLEYFDEKYTELSENFKVKSLFDMREAYYIGQELKRLCNSKIIDKKQYKDSLELIYDGSSKAGLLKRSFADSINNFISDHSLKITGLSLAAEGVIIMAEHTTKFEFMKGVLLTGTGVEMACIGLKNPLKSPFKISAKDGKLYLEQRDDKNHYEVKPNQKLLNILKASVSDTSEKITKGKHVAPLFSIINALNIYDLAAIAPNSSVSLTEKIGKAISWYLFSISGELRADAAKYTLERKEKMQGKQ